MPNSMTRAWAAGFGRPRRIPASARSSAPARSPARGAGPRRTQIKRLGRGVGRIERTILINLAGPYAQRRYAPRSRSRSEVTPALTAANDFDNVTGLINAMYGTGKVAEAYWRYVEARAEAPA